MSAAQRSARPSWNKRLLHTGSHPCLVIHSHRRPLTDLTRISLLRSLFASESMFTYVHVQSFAAHDMQPDPSYSGCCRLPIIFVRNCLLDDQQLDEICGTKQQRGPYNRVRGRESRVVSIDASKVAILRH